jgi:hypothetical protein
MKQILPIALLSVALCGAAFAQTSRNSNSTNVQVGVIPLPRGVDRIVALDHSNQLLAQGREDDTVRTQVIQVKHVYAGGIARLFGGTVIPTAPFVSPGFSNGGFNSQPSFNAIGGLNNGFNNGFNSGLNNGGFNNGGFNNGFNNGGGNGFLFPQGNVQFGAGQNSNFRFQPNLGNVPRNVDVRSIRQPGLGIGTPAGNFFLPAQTENR